MVEYNKISGIVQMIGDYLKNQGVHITIGDHVHQTLRSYVERQEMNTYAIPDIARAVAVIMWCSAGKVIHESLQWAQVPHIRNTMNPFMIYPSDIRETIVRAHKPEHPDDPCHKAVESIKNSDIANNVLPEEVRRFLESIKSE